ncbi:MAG: cytochrome c biogenesis protein ResB [Myxococcales bacterium]
MVLVVACTLAQVDLGSYAAVHRFMNAFLVWVHLPGTGRKVPVFPGGATVGFVLLVNLLAVALHRLAFRWSKAGLWLVHLGLMVLLAGQFIAGAFQVEMRMPIEEGQTLDYLESPRDMELVLTDATDPAKEDEYAIPEKLLVPGATVEVPGTPLALQVHDVYRNAKLGRRAAGDPPSLATQGVGVQVAVEEEPEVTSDDDTDQRAVFVEPLAADKSYGTWLVSPALGAPQFFFHEGRKWTLSMRARREYLPYSLTLKKFSHDIYLGTDIPKNFSSLVHLSNPARGEERDVLIYMNQPLRYQGRTYYQASFGEGDKLSVLQVVRNPGWLMPYLACALVAAGLLIHFAGTLRRGLARRASLAGSAA